MKSIRWPCWALAAFFAACALPAAAETLYKLIDKNGKVTYSGERPKNFDGQVIRIDIDPNANTATLPKPSPAPGAGGEAARDRSNRNTGNAARDDAEARIAQAREKLEAAKHALQEARDNPGEEDRQLVGKVGGGARTILSEAYVQKLEALEQNVKNAEDELRRAEKER
jgi:uncharacterized protein DUF4124